MTRGYNPFQAKEELAQQVVTHQPAISFSISFQHPFNRAGGRTSNVRQRMKKRKIVLISVVILCVIAAGVFIAVMRSDEFHTTERRLWKNDAITAITKDLKNSDYLKERFGGVPKPMGDFDTSESKWLTEDTIVCRDASWLAYRAQTHKVDPKIHDIFIARASDERWYYSDYHFCIDMNVLESNGQPESLEQFKTEYYLVEFDRLSDDALDQTWSLRGEQAADGNPH